MGGLAIPANAVLDNGDWGPEQGPRHMGGFEMPANAVLCKDDWGPE